MRSVTLMQKHFETDFQRKKGLLMQKPKSLVIVMHLDWLMLKAKRMRLGFVKRLEIQKQKRILTHLVIATQRDFVKRFQMQKATEKLTLMNWATQRLTERLKQKGTLMHWD